MLPLHHRHGSPCYYNYPKHVEIVFVTWPLCWNSLGDDASRMRLTKPKTYMPLGRIKPAKLASCISVPYNIYLEVFD